MSRWTTGQDRVTRFELVLLLLLLAFPVAATGQRSPGTGESSFSPTSYSFWSMIFAGTNWAASATHFSKHRTLTGLPERERSSAMRSRRRRCALRRAPAF